MPNKAINEKTNAFIDYFNHTPRTQVDFLVDGIGWLVILKENIEIVSDNWFASSKYLVSTCKSLAPETSCLLCLTNVYQKNNTMIENTNNVKYNVIFDEVCIYTDKIVAFY